MELPLWLMRIDEQGDMSTSSSVTEVPSGNLRGPRGKERRGEERGGERRGKSKEKEEEEEKEEKEEEEKTSTMHPQLPANPCQPW